MNIWHKKFNELRTQAREDHIHVVVVPHTKLKDYAGIHSELAKDWGYKMPKDTIYIDGSMPWKTKCQTLNHELYEFDDMKNGEKYWPAHVRALKHEG